MGNAKKAAGSVTEVPASAPTDVSEILAGPMEPVRIPKRGVEPDDLITIFELDGREYKVSRRINPMIVMQWYADSQRIGSSPATAKVLNDLLGDESIEALRKSPDVREEDIASIYKIIGKIFFDGVTSVNKAQGN